MKKLLVTVTIFVFALSSINAQNNVPNSSPVPQMDSTVKTLAGEMHKKLLEKKVQKITVGQFVYRGLIPPFGTYWVNQLTNELTNMPNKTYTFISGGADFTISGEIVDIANVIRVYTRLIRSDDRSVEVAFQSDFEKTPALSALLIASSSEGRSSSAPPDEYEVDSWENPVACEIGVDANAVVINRTIHGRDDEDFFVMLPDRNGRLTAETTGNFDTVMELYNAESREKLAEDDDSGSGSNAKIRYSVEAGKRYIAKVSGYSSAGSYGFRAYIATRTGGSTWENPVAYEIGNTENPTLVNRTIDGDVPDYFLIVPANSGRLVIETSGSMDTYMKLYDADTRQELASDDDGGSSYNAKITYNAQAGKRYMIMITDLDENGGSFGFMAYLVK